MQCYCVLYYYSAQMILPCHPTETTLSKDVYGDGRTLLIYTLTKTLINTSLDHFVCTIHYHVTGWYS